MTWRAMAAIGLASMALASPAPGQEKGPWIGRRVFTQFGAVLKVGNDVVDDEGRTASLRSSGKDRAVTRVYRVQHVNGEWLWLKDEKSGVSGWVQSKWVVPYEQAIDFYTTQIRSNPQAYLYCRRGNVWQEKGEYDIAIADFNEAIRLEPNEAIYFNNRGLARANKKEYDRAIADWNEAIRLDPNFALAYYSRGLAWANKKEYDKAVADYGEAIRLDPNFALAYYSRGLAWAGKSEYDRAIADWNEAIRLDPNFALAYYSRGLAWANKKEYDKAVADYGEAIRLDPKYATAYLKRGHAWANKRDYDKAVADYGEAIRLDPTYAWAYNNRAWIWATCPDEKYRDGKKAVESATRACELTEWKEAGQIDTLAAAYAEAGDFAKAVEWQDKALKLAPGEDKKELEAHLVLYRDRKPYRSER